MCIFRSSLYTNMILFLLDNCLHINYLTSAAFSFVKTVLIWQFYVKIHEISSLRYDDQISLSTCKDKSLLSSMNTNRKGINTE